MSIDIDQEVAAMQRLSIGELREKYERVFGETTTTRHAECLIRRIAWRLQANEQGALTERARQRAIELADEAELRLTAPKTVAPPPFDGETVTRPAPEVLRQTDDELAVGAQIERLYKGQKIVVTIAENGVRWKGDLYRSLTAVARAVTGSHWNGRVFFGLPRRADA
jgi:hypothetical protein